MVRTSLLDGVHRLYDFYILHWCRRGCEHVRKWSAMAKAFVELYVSIDARIGCFTTPLLGPIKAPLFSLRTVIRHPCFLCAIIVRYLLLTTQPQRALEDRLSRTALSVALHYINDTLRKLSPYDASHEFLQIFILQLESY